MAHSTDRTELSLLETGWQRRGQGDVTPNWGPKPVGVKGGDSHQFLESDFIWGESSPVAAVQGGGGVRVVGVVEDTADLHSTRKDTGRTNVLTVLSLLSFPFGLPQLTTSGDRP